MTSTRRFLSAFAACQLAARVENPARISVAEKVAVAAVAIADAERLGFLNSTEMNYDFFCDEIAKFLTEYPVSNDKDLESLLAEVIAKAKAFKIQL